MNRDEARDRILDYAYDEMSDVDRAEFQALLAQDDELRREVESITQVREAVRGLPSVELPDAVRQRILDAAGQQVAARRQTARPLLEALQDFFLSPAFLGTLAVLIAVGVGMDLVLDHGTEDRLQRVEREEHVAVRRAREPGMAPAQRSPVQERAAAVEAPAEAEPRETSKVGTVESAAGRAAPRARKRQARPTVSSDTEDRIVGGLLASEIEARGAGGLVQDRDGAAGFGGIGSPEDALLENGVGETRAGVRGAGGGRPAAVASPPAPASKARIAPAKVAEPSQAEARKSADRAVEKPSAAMAQETTQSAAVDSVGDYDDETQVDAARDYRHMLSRARTLKDRGLLKDALDLYRRILAGAPPPDLMRTALGEAAEIAQDLGLANEARDYRNRLAR